MLAAKFSFAVAPAATGDHRGDALVGAASEDRDGSAEAAAAVTPGDNKSRHSLDVRIRFAREKQTELSLRNPTGFAIRTLADGSRDADIDAWLAAKRRRAEAARHQSERERIEYEARRAEAIALSLRGGEYSREELLILAAFALKPRTEPATRTA